MSPAKKKELPAHERKVDLNDDGSIDCACGLRIVFLPPALPGGGPNSVNHPGCPAADAGSPAGADLDGRYEMINWIDRGQVEAFYQRQADAAKAAAAAAKP
jgi:hypothetical protein